MWWEAFLVPLSGLPQSKPGQQTRGLIGANNVAITQRQTIICDESSKVKSFSDERVGALASGAVDRTPTMCNRIERTARNVHEKVTRISAAVHCVMAESVVPCTHWWRHDHIWPHLDNPLVLPIAPTLLLLNQQSAQIEFCQLTPSDM